jgi:hypothetical protein
MEKTETTIELSDFEFELNEDDRYRTVTLIKYSGKSRKVIVPAHVGGIPITVIGASPFEGCKKIRSITLPKGIAKINREAFEFGCDDLSEIVVDKENQFFTSYEGVLFDKKMTTLIMHPQSRKGDYIVPDTVIAIELDAFVSCEKLTRIFLPQETIFINCPLTFAGCKRLTDIIVNKNNLKYSSIDGVLFNKEKNELLNYPQGKKNKDYIVQEGIYRIEDLAFFGCKRLVSITLPKSLKGIGNCAFDYCFNLKTIKLSRKTKTTYKTFEDFSGQLVYLD